MNPRPWQQRDPSAAVASVLSLVLWECGLCCHYYCAHGFANADAVLTRADYHIDFLTPDALRVHRFKPAACAGAQSEGGRGASASCGRAVGFVELRC